ncbi:hypothetical protein [Ferrimonas marina]|uniref:Uncharacterized protein n=1 Tax=Ferrimonas marina TaxID=299255 RepID=A0A1M5XWZ5_9GAMM|nr:hypothetical protein [Ferrimonas marina]SHI04094.1 hypothetical protein SAMN02745129_3756 [Ferrimonas marina]
MTPWMALLLVALLSGCSSYVRTTATPRVDCHTELASIEQLYHRALTQFEANPNLHDFPKYFQHFDHVPSDDGVLRYRVSHDQPYHLTDPQAHWGSKLYRLMRHTLRLEGKAPYHLRQSMVFQWRQGSYLGHQVEAPKCFLGNQALTSCDGAVTAELATGVTAELPSHSGAQL